MAFRIAHLTDIHISAPWDTVLRMWTGKRFLGGLNMLLFRQRELQNAFLPRLVKRIVDLRIDHTVVTGDLSTTSLDAEFAQAAALLAPLRDRLSVIPGNHDAYTSWAFEKRRFDHHFQPFFPDSSAAKGSEALPSFYPYAQDIGEGIVIIGCNTAVPTGLTGSWGRLGEGQRVEVESLLSRTRGSFRVLLLHHFLRDKDGQPGLPRRGLRDRDAFFEMIKRTGAELLLHGHEHARYAYRIEGPQGPIPVCNPGPATRAGENLPHHAGFLVYTIDQKRLVSIEHHTLNPQTLAFSVYQPFPNLLPPKTPSPR